MKGISNGAHPFSLGAAPFWLKYRSFWLKTGHLCLNQPPDPLLDVKTAGFDAGFPSDESAPDAQRPVFDLRRLEPVEAAAIGRRERDLILQVGEIERGRVR